MIFLAKKEKQETEVKEDIVLLMQREFGKDSICRLGDTSKFDVEFRSSGSILMDIMLGGGWAKSRAVELAGEFSSGKTTIALMAIAEAQKSEPDLENVLVDTECAFNSTWAATLGIDVNKLIIIQPDDISAQDIWGRIEFLLKHGKIAYIVLDSIAGLVPKSELEEEDWSKDSMGGCAKINAKAMRKILNSGILTKSGATLMCTNQLRDKIGVMYGNPSTTGGGRALKFAYSQRVDVARGEEYAKGQGVDRVVSGNEIKLKASKNKVGVPYKQAQLNLYYDSGVDRLDELVKVAKMFNILKSGGAWITYMNPDTGEIFKDKDGKDMKFNGQKAVLEYIYNDSEAGGTMATDIFDMIQERIRG